jgi:2-hydroxychromene-2-carboxylate isomerase
MSGELEVKFYFAYTSPFTYLAWSPARDLERTHRVRLRFIPYGVNIRRVYGNLDNADADRRKVRYLYLDARRIAAERGLTIYPPKKIYSCRLAFYGGMFAARHGRFIEYSDIVFERFWRHELNVENFDEIAAVLRELRLDPAALKDYIAGSAREDLDRCFEEADRDAVFGVPTLVVDGELFWGEDRIDWVVKKLDKLGLRRDQP